VDVSAISTVTNLPYDPGTDTLANFTAPGGQAITVLVKGPHGVTAQTACPSSVCYVMRAVGQGETPDAYFPAAVAAALAAGARKLVIPRGTYQFTGPAVSADSTNGATCNEAHYWNCAPHWTIGTYPATLIQNPTSIADLDINLSGSVLEFAAPGIGISIVNVARLKLENFTIDWPALQIASLGTIVADPTNPGHKALVLDAAYSAIDTLTGTPVQIQAVDPWDDSTVPGIAPGRFDMSATNAHETYFTFGNPPAPVFVGNTSAGGQTFSCSPCNFVNSATDATCSMFAGCANFDAFASGQRVIVRHYTYNGFVILTNWSNDVDLENVHILTGPGMGIGVANDGGFRGFRVGDSSIVRASGRLISTASDGINVSQIGGDVLMENDEVAYQGDDGLNISTSTFGLTMASPGNLSVPGGCDAQTRDVAVNGDTLSFFDPNQDSLGTALAGNVTAVPCGGPNFLTMTIDCTTSSACTALTAGLDSEDGFANFTQTPAARFVIRDNYFHENRGHGTFLGAPFGELNANTYYRDSMGAITLDAFGDLATANVLLTGNVSNLTP
jgi:hypothetical protein